MLKRTLTITPEGATITGGKEPVVMTAERPHEDAADYTRTAERVLARMSSWIRKAGAKPWELEVLIVAPVKLLWGFQRSSIRVTWPAPQPATAAPNPKAVATKKAKRGKAA